jgi:hypothetical protein
MAEKVKKAETTAKPKKAAAPKKEAALSNLTQMTASADTNTTVHQPAAHSHEQVAQLAHRFWAERGHRHGHHVEDWLRAEQELRGKAS